MIHFLIICMTLISNLVIASDGSAKPWTVHRKEVAKQADAKTVVPWQDTVKGNKITDLFDLMTPGSQLKDFCLKYSGSYHCKNIAEILFCAIGNKSAGHESYCDSIGHGSANSNSRRKASDSLSYLAREHKLSPQDAAGEVDNFLKVLDELAK